MHFDHHRDEGKGGGGGQIIRPNGWGFLPLASQRRDRSDMNEKVVGTMGRGYILKKSRI